MRHRDCPSVPVRATSGQRQFSDRGRCARCGPRTGRRETESARTAVVNPGLSTRHRQDGQQQTWEGESDVEQSAGAHGRPIRRSWRPSTREPFRVTLRSAPRSSAPAGWSGRLRIKRLRMSRPEPSVPQERTRSARPIGVGEIDCRWGPSVPPTVHNAMTAATATTTAATIPSVPRLSRRLPGVLRRRNDSSRTAVMPSIPNRLRTLGSIRTWRMSTASTDDDDHRDQYERDSLNHSEVLPWRRPR